MPSNAELFFEKIMSATDRAIFLRNLVNSTPPTFEEDWLDFKSGTSGNQSNPTPLDDTSVQQLWSKALSGFANTGGGVLIFGIDARKSKAPNGQEIDGASALRLVPHPDALKTRLMGLHHMATESPVAGIRIEPVPDPSGGGFVVCYIPESNAKPHRAESITNKPYYLRVGDDFVVMPHAVLRSMFYPRFQPRIELAIKNRPDSALGGSPVLFTLDIEVYNTGTATARDLAIVVSNDLAQSLQVSPYRRWGPDWELRPGDQALFSSNYPLHPKQRSTLINVAYALEYEPSSIKNSEPRLQHAIRFIFDVFMLDSPPQRLAIQYPAATPFSTRSAEIVEASDDRFGAKS